MSILLISDLHLSPERPEITAAFFAFLEQSAARAEALYILGDLFETWIGDDDPAPLVTNVTAALRRISRHGTRVYLQRGNRDFAIGKSFCRETGCTLLPDHYVANFYGEQLLLLHGDTLCTDDRQYQRFRRWIRCPPVLGLLRLLPLKVRRKLAARAREKSMASNANKAENIMDVAPNAVVAALQRAGVQTMIHGHTHRPGAHALQANGKSAERFVLGDWDRQAWVLTARPSGLELTSFDIEPLPQIQQTSTNPLP